ncbi:MAG: ATP-binding protein [Alphaproteobacteria bacterium]|uniref:ATP-binding protein n=1 Tax=Candidatus Nitrobium versatile TaxID=2884831 RepID=A0A953J8X4_9BACT|nr:ATP-binding protein [Candidatus Nitrobium versatile]
MIHYLPTIKSQKDGFDRLAELAVETKEIFNNVVELDFSRCGFFDANMAAPLAAVLTKLSAERFNRIEIVNIPTAIKNILCKNRFLIPHGYDPVVDANQTALPFIRLQLKDENRFSDYLNKHLNGKGIPRMTRAMGKMFRQSVFEVFQNVVIHSGSELGVFICGQFYPQLQRLDLTIADTGVGIRTNVRRFLRNNKLSSIAALKWALQEGNTTKTGTQPGGVGLKFLKDFIELNGGKIQIASRYGFYEYNRVAEVFSKLAADFTGTAVNLEINTGDTHTYKLSSEISSKDIF